MGQRLSQAPKSTLRAAMPVSLRTQGLLAGVGRQYNDQVSIRRRAREQNGALKRMCTARVDMEHNVDPGGMVTLKVSRPRVVEVPTSRAPGITNAETPDGGYTWSADLTLPTCDWRPLRDVCRHPEDFDPLVAEADELHLAQDILAQMCTAAGEEPVDVAMLNQPDDDCGGGWY